MRRSSSPPLTVLVVDDDTAACESATRLLAHLGHRVTAASDVDEAIRVIAGQSFDVVLCNHICLRRGGLELYWVLKKQGRPEADRFILMTQMTPKDIATDVAVISKPFDMDRLKNAIWSVAQDAQRRSA